MADSIRKCSPLVSALICQVQAGRLPGFVEELEFHPDRKWRFDLAWTEFKVAVEVDGGTRTGGRHVRNDGFRDDAEKRREAEMLGWMVINITRDDIEGFRKVSSTSMGCSIMLCRNCKHRGQRRTAKGIKSAGCSIDMKASRKPTGFEFVAPRAVDAIRRALESRGYERPTSNVQRSTSNSRIGHLTPSPSPQSGEGS